MLPESRADAGCQCCRPALDYGGSGLKTNSMICVALPPIDRISPRSRATFVSAKSAFGQVSPIVKASPSGGTGWRQSIHVIARLSKLLTILKMRRQRFRD